MTKACSKCKEVKPYSDFYKNTKAKDGYRSSCKQCKSEQWKKYYEIHRDSMLEYQRNWNENNPEKRKEQGKRRWQKYGASGASQRKYVYKYDPEKERERSRKHREKFPDKVRAKERRKDKKLRSTPKGKLNQRMSGAIREAIREHKAGRSWEALVGYTVLELKKHIEKLFTDGMSWENISEWHIDHINPKKTFNYETPDDPEFKECWALSNLQPLWAMDNYKKGTKIIN